MLAINGGSPQIKNANAAHKPYPHIGKEEHKYLKQVLQSGQLWGTWAPMTKELEAKWANMVNTGYCLAVCSGTSALHCALLGCGIKAADEVIVPAYSFIATASSVLMVNAIPIFVDVDATGNICADEIEKNISSKTKAIIVVHIHGLPADMQKIKAIADKHKLALIEDCAQAHGASINGHMVGSIGDVGTFSLNATKALAGGEGGLITTNNEKIFNRMAKIRVFGMEQLENKKLYRNADGLGYNYRITEFASAFTLARLKSFEAEKTARIKNVKHFLDGIRHLKGLAFEDPEKESSHVYQILKLRLDPMALGISLDVEVFRHRLLLALEKEGCQFWVWEGKSLPAYTIFKEKNADFGGLPWNLPEARKDISYNLNQYPMSNSIVRDSICTTSHYPPNGIGLMADYVEVFKKVWAHIEDVARINAFPQDSKYIKPFWE